MTTLMQFRCVVPPLGDAVLSPETHGGVLSQAQHKINTHWQIQFLYHRILTSRSTVPFDSGIALCTPFITGWVCNSLGSQFSVLSRAWSLTIVPQSSPPSPGFPRWESLPISPSDLSSDGPLMHSPQWHHPGKPPAESCLSHPLISSSFSPPGELETDDNSVLKYPLPLLPPHSLLSQAPTVLSIAVA